MTAAPDLTEDLLMGGRVRLRQPRGGLRAGSDALFLAAAVPLPEAGRPLRVLDAGCGVGTAGLAVLARARDAGADGVSVTGLEIEPALAALASGNAAANGWTAQMTAVCGDLGGDAGGIAPNAFDEVMTNPPFFDPAKGPAAPDPVRARARSDGPLGMGGWIARAARFVRPRGHLTLIFRAERLDEALAAIAPGFGGVAVFPLWPAADLPAKRVILRARKGVRTPLRLLPGLVLHDRPERYTAAAEEVLREGRALAL
ncbi:MAG: methyltransferase [Alphaproteobacteria bacterium]|nr:methyltransferase [Alphaproteobacteria bacterium]MDX5368816.1 methyltransferase [Alphaproteobacteria bacterium]MDX5463544.1 methyltransferase [Alphaproteobacteria bacterium]